MAIWKQLKTKHTLKKIKWHQTRLLQVALHPMIHLPLPSVSHSAFVASWRRNKLLLRRCKIDQHCRLLSELGERCYDLQHVLRIVGSTRDHTSNRQFASCFNIQWLCCKAKPCLLQFHLGRRPCHHPRRLNTAPSWEHFRSGSEEGTHHAPCNHSCCTNGCSWSGLKYLRPAKRSKNSPESCQRIIADQPRSSPYLVHPHPIQSDACCEGSSKE